MSDKIKLSIIADAGAPTGFATVTHNLALNLQESGEYDISILGINYDGRPNQWSKQLNIWPARLGGDSLGIGYSKQFVQETNPDVLFLFQDIWNIPQYMTALRPMQPGVVIYYPVDSPNIKGNFMVTAAAATEVVCYTEFGVAESVRAATEAWDAIKVAGKQNDRDVVDTLTVNVNGMMDIRSGADIGGGEVIVPARSLLRLTNKSGYEIIPHAVDTSSFHKVDKAEARKSLDIDPDWFVVGNVNRNQSRKRQDLSIRAFSKFADDKPEARLLLHCVRYDPRGWDLPQLARYYGVEDKLILTHSLFEDLTASIEELNMLYNSFDVQINTCGGEGWGLTNFEGAACGIPQVVPDWSATGEIWRDSALLIDVAEVRHEMSLINTMQAVVSTDHTAELLQRLYDDPNLMEEVGKKCFEVTQKSEYTWDSVSKRFDKVFKRAAGRPPVRGEVALTVKGMSEIKKMNQHRFERVVKHG